MDWGLTETQTAMRDAARAFAKGRLKPLVEKMDREGEYDTSLISELGELGFFGVRVPEEWGGIGADTLSYSLVLEELSRVCPSTAVMLSVHNSLLNEVLLRFADPAQKERYLRKAAAGECVGAFAITEPDAGSDAASIRLRAENLGGRYLLNGTKIFITNAAYAHLFIVFASTEPDKKSRGITAFFVDRGTEGFSLGKKEDKMGLRASSTMELVFSDALVPSSNRIGGENQGFGIAMKLLDGGRVGIASQALGIAEAAFDEALCYSRTRVQFGKSISEYQAIQWKLADMATEIEAARGLVRDAARLADSGRPYSLEASMAKLFASEMSNRVVNHALQVFGGYGYMKEFPIERIYRDQRVTQLYEGTSEIQRLVIARHLLSS